MLRHVEKVGQVPSSSSFVLLNDFMFHWNLALGWLVLKILQDYAYLHLPQSENAPMYNYITNENNNIISDVFLKFHIYLWFALPQS